MTLSTITLLIYILFLTPLMLLGYYFARRKMFDPQHKLVMTSVVILNWVLIGVVMFSSYLPILSGLPEGLDNTPAIIATVHGIFGIVAQLLATYLVLLMWTEDTALSGIVIYRIKNIKTPMRFALTLWLITVALGFGVYGVWYGGDASASDDTPPPAVTEEASADIDLEEEIIAPDSTEEAETTNQEPASASTEASDTEQEDPEPDTTEES